MTDKKMADPQASQNNNTPKNVNTRTTSLVDNSTVFLDIRKSDSERLRIGVSEYRGRVSVDLRVWYSIEGGEFKPGRAGVTLRPSQVAEVVQGLMLAARSIDPQEGR
ncbi:MAG: transcriptional coactivator p15/PC4 family protein [Pseudomonadota bacterium]|nr:transcriptional coactivator p15/PC4 family protein [Pseudomonadota bacterium]